MYIIKWWRVVNNKDNGLFITELHGYNPWRVYKVSLCFSKMVDKDGRNFRAFYYDTLGLRNVEQRKALEILLKDDPIGW